MKLSENQVIAIKRKRGELDMSINGLEKATGVSRWTLISIFKHDIAMLVQRRLKS